MTYAPGRARSTGTSRRAYRRDMSKCLLKSTRRTRRRSRESVMHAEQQWVAVGSHEEPPNSLLQKVQPRMQSGR